VKTVTECGCNFVKAFRELAYPVCPTGTIPNRNDDHQDFESENDTSLIVSDGNLLD